MARLKLPARLRRIKCVADAKMVLVVWRDAARAADYDGAPADIPEMTVINHTLGFLVEVTRDTLTIVQDISPYENTSRWPYGIPRGMVVSVTQLVPPPELDTPLALQEAQ